MKNNKDSILAKYDLGQDTNLRNTVNQQKHYVLASLWCFFLYDNLAMDLAVLLGLSGVAVWVSV